MSSAAIRARLRHPVIDADGHLVECPPVLMDFLKQAGGTRLAARYEETMSKGAWGAWRDLGAAERRERGIMRRPFWAMPAHTRDRATALLPGLLRSRLDEFGIDFQIVYPTIGIPFISGAIDEEMRRGMCRARISSRASALQQFAGFCPVRGSRSIDLVRFSHVLLSRPPDPMEISC